MSLQVKRRKSKKAVSIIIGYVLLITFAVIIGVLVYRWMKTYVPQEDPSCPDGSTLFIESQTYDCSTGILTLKIVNNGNFNIGGYFIYGSTVEGSELAPLDLTQGNLETDVVFPGTIGVKFGSFYYGEKNSLAPGNIEVERYNLTTFGRIYSIEIIPFRWQTKDRKTSIISCSNSKLKEVIDCFVACTPDDESITCSGVECGTRINNCGEEVDCSGCPTGEECNILGQCVDSGDCTDTCDGLECGSVCGEVCGGECPDFANGDGVCDAGICILGTCVQDWGNCDGNDANGCETYLMNNEDYCGDCLNSCGSLQECIDGYCVTTGTDTCDGVWNMGEENVDCDGVAVPNCNLATCDCNTGYASTGDGGCEVEIPNTITDCSDYCVWLGDNGGGADYVGGDCQLNAQQCRSAHPGGVVVTTDEYNCNDPSDDCCCYP